jgi:hypothetical protein
MAKKPKKPKYPQSEALELARLNAIRMLGLHEHNTPEDRARAMGFEPGWGHGSPHNDIVELKPSRTGALGPGAYATQHLPETAMYAMGKEGATSYPLMVKRAQALDIGMKNPYEHFGVEDDQALKHALHDADKTGMVVKQPSTADWLKDLDVADYPERNHYVSMHPHTFRSRFAAFDPARAHEAGLNYKEGGDVEPTPDQMRRALAQRGHLTSTPKKRNLAVGQRFDVSEATGLAPKIPVDLEKHKGASMMVMPWDSTSRNVQVRGISGHELPEAITTHGGQDYARDLEHMAQGVAGASGEDIAKRIATRESIARIENEQNKGTGQLLHLPITMGKRGEDFSMTPTEILHQLVMRGMLPKKELDRINKEIRNHSIIKNEKRIKPFSKFVGLEHPDFEHQITTGEGLGTTAGELRKAIVDRVGYLKANQKVLDFNMEDVVNAVTDPALRGVPKGYIGNTVIGSDPDHMTLTPSKNKAYDTNFSGQYLGTLGHSFPAEVLFGDKMADLHKEFADKQGDRRTMVLGALEKRNDNISQILNNKTLDDYGKYMMARDKKLRTGHYAEGGEVKAEPSQDEMLAHVMLNRVASLKDVTSLKNVGVNEAPNLPVKAYVPPGTGPGLPVGGVDFQPEMPGQQVLPGQPAAPMGAMPPQPGQPAGQMPPTGQPQGQPPAPAPGAPRSNILQMTQPGQALAAMRPNQPMPRMAGGGTIKDYIRITERPL